VKKFTYSYDAANQLIKAEYNLGLPGVQNYDMRFFYDELGNITNLTRNGRVRTASGYTYAGIDNLAYTYEGNHLKNVSDKRKLPYAEQYGFIDGLDSETEYTYDANGNMLTDLNRNTDLTYNPMDLIKTVDFKNGQRIEYFYTATGAKLKAVTYVNNLVSNTVDYCGRFMYENSKLASIQSSEGRIVVNYSVKLGASFFCEYQIKDHQGNVVSVFNQYSTVLQENAYYPYGMPMDGLCYTALPVTSGKAAQTPDWFAPNRLQYNGHETQTQLSLGWIDYGFRQMDPVLCVWHSADKLAETTADLSPYCYAGNDPINRVDMYGLWFMIPALINCDREFEEVESGACLGTRGWGGGGGNGGRSLGFGVGGTGYSGPHNYMDAGPSSAYVSNYIDAQNNATAPFKGTYGEYVQMMTNPGSFGGDTYRYESYSVGTGDGFNYNGNIAKENLVTKGNWVKTNYGGPDNPPGATVYVETDGIGHTYIEVNGTVFSYGRYDGSFSPSSGRFGPVGPGVLLKKTHQYAVDRMKKSPTTIYSFPNANSNAIYDYMNNAYNSGTPAPHGGMIIDTYFLFGNNCTTVTVGALRIGGVEIDPLIQTPIGFFWNMQFPNQFGTGYPPR
jgi:RHS repeat-associated protein